MLLEFLGEWLEWVLASPRRSPWRWVWGVALIAALMSWIFAVWLEG